MPVCVLVVCTGMYLCVLPSVTEVDETLSKMYSPHGWMGPHSVLHREESEAGIKCGASGSLSSQTLPLATMQQRVRPD